MVDSVNGMPAACAARQARISPSPCCMPHSPIGASASGSDAGSPRIVVLVLRAGDVAQDALAQFDALEIGAVGAQRLLGIGAGFGIIDERARHLAVRGLPQVLDAGHGFHAAFPGTLAQLSTRLIAQSRPQPWRPERQAPQSLLYEAAQISSRAIRKGDHNGSKFGQRPDKTARTGSTRRSRTRRKARGGAGTRPRGKLSRLRPGGGHPAAASARDKQ